MTIIINIKINIIISSSSSIVIIINIIIIIIIVFPIIVIIIIIIIIITSTDSRRRSWDSKLEGPSFVLLVSYYSYYYQELGYSDALEILPLLRGVLAEAV